MESRLREVWTNILGLMAGKRFRLNSTVPLLPYDGRNEDAVRDRTMSEEKGGIAKSRTTGRS